MKALRARERVCDGREWAGGQVDGQVGGQLGRRRMDGRSARASGQLAAAACELELELGIEPPINLLTVKKV